MTKENLTSLSEYFCLENVLKIDSEDKLKIEIFNLIDYYSRGFFDNSPRCYHRVASRIYEEAKYELHQNLKGIVKKYLPNDSEFNQKKKNIIRNSYSSHEYILKTLYSYSEGYLNFDTKHKLKRDRESVRFIKKFTQKKDKSALLKYYRIYNNMKKDDHRANDESQEFY